MTTCSSRFEADNEGIDVVVDVVPYQAILENLPVQLAAGTGPDIAKVTDLGGLNEYYLDLTPYVDAAYWEASFGGTLDWYRGGPDDQGIYGMHSQLTITGAFVNATLFEQAGIEMPGADATWADWAEASRAVAEATDTPFPMAIDRSGHRVAGPAISYGAALFGPDGDADAVDEGFTAFVQQFVDGTRTAPSRATSGPVRAARPTRTRRRSSSTASWCSTTPAPGRSAAWTNRSATSSTGRSWAPPAVRRAHAPACRAARASSASSRPRTPKPWPP
jgi:ABC-type glycerol-3-phosphate transport system substrate-binding protein